MNSMSQLNNIKEMNVIEQVNSISAILNDPVVASVDGIYYQKGQEKYGEWTKNLCLLRSTNNMPDGSHNFEGTIYLNNPTTIVYHGIKHMLLYNPEQHPDYISKNNVIAIEKLVEGSKVGIYWYEGKWRVATNQTINAEFSRWHSAKSFEELTWDCLMAHLPEGVERTRETVEKLLSIDTCYTFVICHPENVITTEYPFPAAKLIQARNMDTFNELTDEVYQQFLGQFSGLTRPEIETIDRIMTSEEIVERIPKYNTGFIMRFADDTRISVENPEYTNSKKMKGNIKSIKLRLVELYGTPQFADFTSRFSHIFNNEIKEISSVFYNLAVVIFNEYRTKFVYHKTLKVNPLITKFCYEIHSQYKETKKPISLNDVEKKLAGSDMARKVFLLKHMMYGGNAF